MKHSKLIPATRKASNLLWIALASTVAMPGVLHGQTAPAETPSAPDASATERLVKRLDAQEAEIKELREKLAGQQPAVAPTTGPSSTELKKQLDEQGAAVTDLKGKVDDVVSQAQQAAAAKDTYPTLQFHAFADIDYHVSNNKLDHNAFTLGEFDVFLQSQLAEQWSVLTETVLSVDTTNSYGVEVERLLVQYKGSDYFNVDIGRYHTSIGYYNTAYHHGTWFQTAENRPFFLQFEDSGGVIAAHNVGVSVHGAVPYVPTSLGLNYVAEIGNGRQYSADGTGQNSVGNALDANDYKAVNLALISKPESIPGLQLGAGVYLDRITAAGVGRTEETMVHAHLVYKDADWEFLSEGLAINHNTAGGPDAWSYAYYLQIGRKMGKFTPYARYSYLNAESADPLFQLVNQSGRHYGPSVGCRYDLTDFVAFKLEYEYIVNHGPARNTDFPFTEFRAGAYSQLTAQLAFTF